MSYYLERDSRIRDKIKTVLHLSSYITEKNPKFLQVLINLIELRNEILLL